MFRALFLIILSVILQGCSSLSEVQPIHQVDNGKFIYQDVVIRIYNCRSGMLYIVKDNKLFFPNAYFNYDDMSEYNLEIDIDPGDVGRLHELAGEFLAEDGDLVLENKCIICGSPSKLMIEAKNVKTKRIFIDNYFDSRFNEIGLILNSYLSKQNTGLTITLEAYDEMSDIVRIFTEDQSNCKIKSKEESKMQSLYSWCEPLSWESNNVY